METLPRDVHMYILEKLPAEDIQRRVRYLSHYWRRLSLDSYFWQCQVESLSKGKECSRFRIVPSNNEVPEVKSWEWLYRALTHEVTSLGSQVGYRRGDNNYIFGDLTNGVVHGYGIEQMNKGYTYYGQWNNGHADGYGTFEEKTITYTGKWKAGKRHGLGVYIYGNISRYEGEYANHERHGFGICETYSHNRTTYIGEYDKDFASGFGIFICHNNGSHYIGFHRMDQYHGEGFLSFMDGAYYRGKWKHGIRSGYGEAMNRFGDLYAGEWKDDRPVKTPEFQCQWNGLFALHSDDRDAYIEKRQAIMKQEREESPRN